MARKFHGMVYIYCTKSKSLQYMTLIFTCVL
jgi:hypothetical protein